MYAIKIISGSTTYLYEAEELNYKATMCENSEEFYSSLDNDGNEFILGDVPDGKFEYCKMYLNDSFERNGYKVFYIMPVAWIYIMQNGKTIEPLQVHKFEESVVV